MRKTSKKSKSLLVDNTEYTTLERRFFIECSKYQEDQGKNFLSLVETFRIARKVLGLGDEHDKNGTGKTLREEEI